MIEIRSAALACQLSLKPLPTETPSQGGFVRLGIGLVGMLAIWVFSLICS